MSGNLNNSMSLEGSLSYKSVDHIAIAVRDLPSAIAFFSNVLGFALIQRREVKGTRTGMISAEMEHNGIKFVLCQGTEDESQVSRYIAEFGPGVAHIALAVDDVHSTVGELSARGMEFDTSVIEGAGLTQAFSSRCLNSGLSFELIKRDPSQEGFVDGNVQSLFEQLEASGAY